MESLTIVDGNGDPILILLGAEGGQPQIVFQEGFSFPQVIIYQDYDRIVISGELASGETSYICPWLGSECELGDNEWVRTE